MAAAKRIKAGDTTYIPKCHPLPSFVVWPNIDFSQVTRVEFRDRPAIPVHHQDAMVAHCRPTTLSFMGELDAITDPGFVHLLRFIDDDVTDVWLDPGNNYWSAVVLQVLLRELRWMHKLRHLHASASFCQHASVEWWKVLADNTRLEELTMHGPYDPQVAHVVLHWGNHLRTLRYPDLETLPCFDHFDGWAAHLAATVPSHVLARLEPALQHRIRTYQKQQVDAIAQVLPVVGVPELVAALAFKFRAPGDWAELKQQTE
jgi:hypothetical protein